MKSKQSYNYYNKDLLENALTLRIKQTPAEKFLWKNLLKDFEFHTYRQRPLGNYIVDFFVPKLNLVIEIDGGYHLEKEQQQKDYDRDRSLELIGYKVLRIKNEEVQNLELVKTKILQTQN